jgi:negative regulator of genetic competence, sporulation and motility
MKRICKHIFIVTACLMLSVQVYPQQKKATAATKKNEQVKEANKKAYQKARKKTIKHRREIQTDETRKRMEEADKRAKAYNKRDDRKWYQDIFRRKKPRR